MPAFICALSSRNGRPAAYALLEQVQSQPGGRPSYAILDVARFEEDDSVERIKGLLSRDERIVSHVTVVVQGGAGMARLLHDAGMTTIPVETRPPFSGDGATTGVAEQTIVDTFETVFRASRVALDNESEVAETAIRTLYLAMSDDAGADDLPEYMADLLGEPQMVEKTGAAPDTVEQSGGATSVSTARVAEDRRPRDAQPMSKAEVTPERVGDADDRAGSFAEVDMGEDHDVAMALAMAVWYGEYSADDVPLTDQAWESRRARVVRRARRQEARGR